MLGASADLRARVRIALALTLLLTLGGTLLTAPAHAGHQSQADDCITSYNYADAGIGYLFASTSGNQTYPQPCATVEVSIRNGGCAGTTLAYEHGLEYVDTSVMLPSSSWSAPCSAHYGGYWVAAHWLSFQY